MDDNNFNSNDQYIRYCCCHRDNDAGTLFLVYIIILKLSGLFLGFDIKLNALIADVFRNFLGQNEVETFLRKFQLNSGDRVLMTSEKTFVSLALLEDVSFTDRLVAKFKLPVDGWRGE